MELVYTKPSKTLMVQKIYNVYDIATNSYRKKENYMFPFAKHIIKELKSGNYKEAFEALLENNSNEAKICIQFLIKYVIYSIITTKTIGESIHSADDVMATGFGWVPPLAVIDAFGGVLKFIKLAEDKLPKEFLSKVDIIETFKDVPESTYDYRPFFKAK